MPLSIRQVLGQKPSAYLSSVFTPKKKEEPKTIGSVLQFKVKPLGSLTTITQPTYYQLPQPTILTKPVVSKMIKTEEAIGLRLKKTVPLMTAWYFPGEVKKIVGQIGQEVLRNIASAGLTIATVVAPKKLKPYTDELSVGQFPKLLQGIARTMFRDEPIKSIERRIAEAEPQVKEWGIQLQKQYPNTRIGRIGSFAEKYPASLAFAGIMGSVGIDLTFFGGLEKNAFKAMIKTKTAGEAMTILSKMGVADDLIKVFADDVVRVGSQKEAKSLFLRLAEIQRTTKVVKPMGALEPSKLPVVIQGKTFTLVPTEIIQPPTVKELRVRWKAEIKATKQEIKIAGIARQKAAKLEIKKQAIRQEAIENVNRFHGDTDRVIKNLKARHLSEEDIANIVLEDGTKLTDTVKVKRNPDKSLAAVIKKSEIEDIAKTYTDEVPKIKWEKKSMLVEGVEIPIKAAKSIELPYVWFQRKGLTQIYDPIIQAGRDAEVMKNIFLKRFDDAGLFKRGGWFTADRFNITKGEAESISKYYLTRQNKGFNIAFGDLSPRAQKFVEIFDGIIKETEPRFFETAKLNGKTPGMVLNYAPIMTNKDIRLIDQGGSMDWLFRNHPAFFSLKERAKRVPVELYELDYRNVASRWLDGITDFLNYGETTPKLKYTINSDQFKDIIKESDWQYISNWLRDITTPKIPTSAGGQSLNALSKLLRKGVAMGALGLNYASVAKQALTQIPIMLIEKVLPRFGSQYARAFGINVADLPSITKRRGDIAIIDLQGKIGRIFTGPLTKFDKRNAQVSLNALLDREYFKILKEGAEITPQVQKLIEKRAMDAIDMWYGGFFKGQRPEAFREELGNFILMFLYPLTSQLNGFYRHVLMAQGATKIKAGAEVLAAATIIAYAEQVIENLSPQWSDKVGMTKDILQSLTGNIPVVGNITYAILNEKEMQASPVIGNINNIIRNMGKGEGEKVFWSIAETFGVPRQVRRIKEGMEIMEAGGITDKEGKMLAPVQETIELVRSFLRGKYGSVAAQDWVRNIGEKAEDRRWFVPEVEFLQNGDYARKAELYNQFDEETQKELYSFLSEGQQEKLDNALAQKMYEKLKGIPKTEAKKEFDILIRKQPDMARKINKIIKKEAKEKPAIE